MPGSPYPQARGAAAGRHRRAAALAAALLLLVAVAACGGSEPRPTTANPQPRRPAELSDLRRRLERELRQVLDDQRQAKLVDVDCVIDHLRETLDEPALRAAERAAASAAEIPKEAIDAAFDAGSACARP